jgi:UDP-glucose 4-epimerase
MKTLVTGGAGFIGSHLTDKLIEEGHQVAVIDDLSTGRKENLNPRAHFYEMDITDSGISSVFEKENPEIVFHLAAQINVRQSVENPIEDAKINILGSLNLINSFLKIKHPNSRFIFTSTGGAIYGDTEFIPTKETHPAQPESPYGIAKLSVEHYLHFYNRVKYLNYTCLRLANVYGPRQNAQGEAGVVAIFTNQMLSGQQPVINGDGNQTRDFVFVDDVVSAGLLAMQQGENAVYNIGTGKETNINELFGKIKELTGADVKEKHGEAKPEEQMKSCLDYSLAKDKLGWQPGDDLDSGLEKTINWFKAKNGDASQT